MTAAVVIEDKQIPIYPLTIVNCSGDTECYMSKGHQDFKSFMDSMREYGFDELGDWSAPSHQWWRTVPDRSGEYNVVYVLAEPHSRGAFPVTVMERR